MSTCSSTLNTCIEARATYTYTLPMNYLPWVSCSSSESTRILLIAFLDSVLPEGAYAWAFLKWKVNVCSGTHFNDIYH